MIPKDYFERPDSPMRNSPIGRIMRQLEFLHPDMRAHDLREMAHERNHTSGPQQVKWTKEESECLKAWVDLPLSSPAGPR